MLSNFVSLTDCKQPDYTACVRGSSCELLSNFVSLTDCKQHALPEESSSTVVNCFQTLYL